MGNASVMTDETSIAHAVAQINKGDWSRAEMSLNGILNRNPNHPVGHYLLGLIASEQNRWNDAEKHLLKALSLAPTQSRIVLLLVRSLRALGRSDDALALCQSLPSRDVEIGLEYARCQEETRDFLAAEKTHRVLQHADGSANTVLEFARYLCRRSRAEEAEGLLRRALEETTNIDEAVRSQLNYQLGIVLKSQSRYEEALSHMSDVTSKEGLSRSHIVERAGLLGQLGRLEEAAQTYEVHLNSAPLDLEIHALLNDIYHVLGKEERIGASYDILKATGPQQALLQAAKGRLFLKRGNLQKAEDGLHPVLKTPSLVFLWNQEVGHGETEVHTRVQA
jgi:tetratricopeptide (TPR) repeat protein